MADVAIHEPKASEPNRVRLGVVQSRRHASALQRYRVWARAAFRQPNYLSRHAGQLPFKAARRVTKAASRRGMEQSFAGAVGYRQRNSQPK